MLQPAAEPIRLVRTSAPHPLPAGFEQRLPGVSQCSIVVLIFSALLTLYGIYMCCMSYVELEATQASGLRHQNFGTLAQIISGVLCIVAGLFGVRASIKKTIPTAQEYIRLLGITAACVIVLNGLSVIVGVIVSDCGDATNSGGVQVVCSSKRGVILLAGLLGLAVMIACCAGCLWCARSLLHSLVTESYLAGGVEAGAIPFETYSAQPAAPATSSFYVQTPQSYLQPMQMYTGSPQGQVVFMQQPQQVAVSSPQPQPQPQPHQMLSGVPEFIPEYPGVGKL